MSDIPEEIRKMFPDQPIHKLDIDDSGELHILASAEPLNDPEFENMPIEQVNQYLREHGYDPEQVGIHGKFLQELVKRISALEAEVEALKAERRWTPVVEGVPNGEDVLVIFRQYEDSDPEIGVGVHSEFCISSHPEHWLVGNWYGKYVFKDEELGIVTHWMPLPEPPEGAR